MKVSEENNFADVFYQIDRAVSETVKMQIKFFIIDFKVRIKREEKGHVKFFNFNIFSYNL